MKIRSILFGTAALAAATLVPSRASAQGGGCSLATYSATLGLGGALTGCFTFKLTELGENAGGIANQFYWNGNFVGAGGSPINAPLINPGTFFFNDDCNSSGAVNGPATTFAFCDGTNGTTVKQTGTILNPRGELVLGLDITQDNLPGGGNNGNEYWIYSGAQARNAFPTPAGFQAVLMQLTTGGTTANPGLGTPIDGQFLFAWEDLNTGCTAENNPRNYFRIEDIGDKVVLDDKGLHSCITFNPNGGPGNANSDSDFNDSYIRLGITGTRLDTVTPEPMTMTLMATGLVGLAGASIRRRKKNHG